MQATKTSGAAVWFDLNFREKLWKRSGGEERAREVIGRILSQVDVLVGNEEDLQRGLGLRGPEIGGRSRPDPSAFVGMTKDVAARYPHSKIVATTLREVHSTSRLVWGAVAWINGEVYLSPKLKLDVHDRVVGGDGFASGLFYAFSMGSHRNGGEAGLGTWPRCSRLFLATRPWPPLSRFASWRKAARLAFSADGA